MLLPAHEFVIFDEAHEILDIFATLLGTSLNASRLRALAGGARGLLDDDGRARADQLLASADRFADLLLAQYERGELTGLDESCQVELARANGLVTTLVEGLRAIETASPDAEFRKVRALGPAVHLANDLGRVNKCATGVALPHTPRPRD